MVVGCSKYYFIYCQNKQIFLLLLHASIKLKIHCVKNDQKELCKYVSIFVGHCQKQQSLGGGLALIYVFNSLKSVWCVYPDILC